MQIKRYIGISTLFLINILILGILMSCFSPRYTWHFGLLEKENPKFSMGEFEVVLWVVADKESDDTGDHHNEGNLPYTIAFKTLYKGPLLSRDSTVQLLLPIIDSVYIIQPPEKDIQPINLTQSAFMKTEMTKIYDYLQDDNAGPEFVGLAKIYKHQEKIEIGFKAIAINCNTKEIVDVKRINYELIRFENRSWIIAD